MFKWREISYIEQQWVNINKTKYYKNTHKLWMISNKNLWANCECWIENKEKKLCVIVWKVTIRDKTLDYFHLHFITQKVIKIIVIFNIVEFGV